MTGISCDRCGLRNATQVLRIGTFCATCYTDIVKGGYK